MEKIKTYKIGKRGHRGTVVSLPRVWLNDVSLGPGDVVEFYRDSNHNLGDVLVLRRGK